MKYLKIFLMVTLLSTSCAGVKTMRYTIASQTAECEGASPQRCMLVKKGASEQWQYFYYLIEGFDHREGYEYVLEVKEKSIKKPLADASSIRYILKKEIASVQKTSEGLSQMVAHKQDYQVVGVVKAVALSDAWPESAQGHSPIRVAQIEVTSSQNSDIKSGDIIYCELADKPQVEPVEGREYVFRSPARCSAYTKGVRLLQTNVIDLVR